MTTIDVKAKERKRILRKFSNSMDVTYRFTAEPAGNGQDVSGTVEVKGSRWIFPKAAVSQPLARDNSVVKGMWDSFYSVHVTPDSDVRIVLQGARYPKLSLYLAIVALIVGLAAAMMIIISVN